MKISEMLQAIASWLEDSNNSAIILAENDDDCLKIVAQSCIEAADILKKAADEVSPIEPQEESVITTESIDELASIAEAFDASGNVKLQKQASVIDELILTIAAPKNSLAERKDLEDNRIEQLKKKYKDAKNEQPITNKIADIKKDLQNSSVMKQYNILEAPLSTRYCPDHAGIQIARIGEHEWQCELDKKVYNFDNGFTLINGDKVPGGNVENQSSIVVAPMHSVFDSREERLQTNRP
jgi:hypothetical protein